MQARRKYSEKRRQRMEPESEKDERKVQAEIETKKEGVNTKQR